MTADEARREWQAMDKPERAEAIARLVMGWETCRLASGHVLANGYWWDPEHDTARAMEVARHFPHYGFHGFKCEAPPSDRSVAWVLCTAKEPYTKIHAYGEFPAAICEAAYVAVRTGGE